MSSKMSRHEEMEEEEEVSDGELVEAVEEYEVSYWNVFTCLLASAKT